MTTLLLRLTGPMQSWGTQSRFSMRDSGLEPSKSGVIGLLCAALGRPREEPVADLAALRMGVRADREGVLRTDYQTAGGWHFRRDAGYGVPNPSGKGHRTVVSERSYLADADFLVGLEGDERLLESIDQAIRYPQYQIFLGRKSFVPGAPVGLPDVGPWGPGLRRGEDLEQALQSFPWFGDLDPRRFDRAPEQLRVAFEHQDGGSLAEVRPDHPVSFDDRRYSTRYVYPDSIPTPRLEEEDVSLTAYTESA